MEPDFKHIVLTRYFTRFSNSASDVQEVLKPDRAWLEDRLAIFVKYCLPSVLAQSVQNFTWLIYMDINTPPDYVERVRTVIGPRENIKIVICDGFNPETRAQSINAELTEPTKWLLTTRFDTDDGWHKDFVKLLQENLRFDRRQFFNFPVGILYFDGKTFLYRHQSNAFISLLESPEDALTAFCAPHTELDRIAPIVQLPQVPAFLQVVHGRNRSNKPRGVRVPFTLARCGFESIFGPAESEDSESDWAVVAYNLRAPLVWTLRDRAIAVVRGGMKMAGRKTP
jgi:hypothetical protein